jgi:hypothetical protein
MPKSKRLPPALKHGAYSEAALLPGEDPAEFKALHKGLIADLRPNGRMEEETVLSIARLTWRRQNLARFELGQLSHYVFETLKTVVGHVAELVGIEGGVVSGVINLESSGA